jgi:hypothetical protein
VEHDLLHNGLREAVQELLRQFIVARKGGHPRGKQQKVRREVLGSVITRILSFTKFSGGLDCGRTGNKTSVQGENNIHKCPVLALAFNPLNGSIVPGLRVTFEVLT